MAFRPYPCSAPAFPCAVPCSLPTGPTGPAGSSVPSVILSLNTVFPPSTGTAVAQAVANGTTAVVPFATEVANSLGTALWNNLLYSFTPTTSGWFSVSFYAFAANPSTTVTTNADLIVKIGGTTALSRSSTLALSPTADFQTTVGFTQLFYIPAGVTLQALVGNSSANAVSTTFSNQTLNIVSLF